MVSVMLITFYTLVLLINYTEPLKDLTVIRHVENKKSVTEKILCRNCGIHLSSSNYIISKQSSASQMSVYDSLYGKEDVLIQILVSDIFFQFPVISTEHSSCVGTGEWQESDSWYPHYRWRPCICPECGSYVGWVYEPIDIKEAHKHPFFNLILTSIVGETFVDSLIQYPEAFQN